MITLLNRSSSTSFEIDLLHDLYCAKGGPCACTEETYRQQVLDPDGVSGLRPGQRRVWGSVRIAPGDLYTGHEAILELPQVVELLRRGDLERGEAATTRPAKKSSAPTKEA